MLTVLLIIFIFGLLVFVHEFGHFIVAKKAGIKVEEFGFGFPPRILGIKRRGTIYSLNAVPLGGFVKIFGEQGEGAGHPESFASKGIWIRSSTVVAGVVMNILLAFLIFIFIFWSGAQVAVTSENQNRIVDRAVSILQVQPQTPAQEAGLRLGDKLVELKIKNETLKIYSVEQFQRLMKEYEGQQIALSIKRGEGLLEKEVVPKINPPEGQGRLGVALVETGIVRYPFFGAIYEALKTTFSLLYFIFVAILKMIGGLIFQFQAPAGVSGPVGIGFLIHQASKLGVNFLLNLTAVISLNLAVLNILPLPALDGGRLLFFAIEALRRGKKVSYKTENLIHAAGFAILIGLAILVTIRDIRVYF